MSDLILAAVGAIAAVSTGAGVAWLEVERSRQRRKKAAE